MSKKKEAKGEKGGEGRKAYSEAVRGDKHLEKKKRKKGKWQTWRWT